MPDKTPLSCTTIHDMISAYIDGNFTDQERDMVEHHCTMCPLCKREMEQMKMVVASVGGMKKYSAPLDFIPHVNERLDAALEKQQSWGARWKKTGVVSYIMAAASLFIVVGYVMHTSDTRIYKGAPALPIMNTVDNGVTSLATSLFTLPLSRNREIIRSLNEPLKTTLTLLDAVVVSVEDNAITFAIPREHYAVAVEHLKAVGYADVTIVEKDAESIQLKIKNTKLKM